VLQALAQLDDDLMQQIDVFRQLVGIEGKHQCALSITGERPVSN
jgi:hypothetical protein